MNNEYWDNAEAEFLIIEIDGLFVPFRVTNWRGKGADSLIFTLKGIDSEDKALPLINHKAYMLRKDIIEDEDATGLTWQDLVGWTVICGNKNIGKISEVDESTINILGILEDGRLVPLHEDLIIELSENTQTITLNLPEDI